MSRRQQLWIFCAISFLFGALCFKMIDKFHAISFDPVFSFGNVISSLTTLVVAVLVTAHLQRQTQVDKSEKELLLRQFDMLFDTLVEFEKFRDGGVLTEINASLKKLSVKSKSIHGILVELKQPKEIITAANFSEVLKKIRKLATDTPIKQIEDHANHAECSSEVKDGIINLATEKRNLLDNKIEDMKLQIIKAQISLNRA
jgi:hypothetical protein